MNSSLLRYFAIVAVVLLASCADNVSPEEHVAKAREYMEAGEFDAANIELKNAASKDPKNASVRFEMANVALALGEGPVAETEARRAEDLGIPSRDVALMLVKAIYLQGDFERVLAATEKLPKNIEASVRADMLGYRAHALIQKQQFRLADAEIAKALKLNEASVPAVLAKASYEAQVGRRETAVLLVKQALEIDPNSSDAWALLGDLYAADGDLAAAKDAYDKAVSHRSYVSLLLARRAFIQAQLKDFAAARSDIKALLDAGYKNYPYVNFVRGYIAFQQENFQLASQVLELAVVGNPEDPMIKLYLVASYMAEGKLSQAQLVANQLYYALPNSVEVARMFASLNMQQQDLGGAKKTLTKLLEQQEDDTIALGMLGSIALMEGNGDEAIDYLERLTALSPNNESVQSMLSLAMTMRGDYVSEVLAAAEQQVSEEEYSKVLVTAGAALEQGRLREALTIAENLQQQYPDRVGPLNLLAAIYLSAGDWRRGKTLLEQALVVEPLEPSAVKSLVKICMRVGEEARAEQLLADYLAVHPQDQEAVGIKSELIVATREYKEAETLLIELLDLDRENLEIKARLVKLYFDNGQFEQVSSRTENLSDQTIRAQPSLMELRGKALANLGNVEGASRVWQKWVELSPDSVLANFYYAGALANDNQLELSLQFLENARKLKPGYLPARLAIIRTTALSGDMEKAFAEMKALQSMMQEDRGDVWYTQGWLNARAGKYPAAEKALKKSLSLQPTPDAAMLFFAALNSQGRSDEATAALEGWSEKFPTHLGLMAVLGQSYVARKETDSAVALYQRMLAADPASVIALNNLAWLLRETDAEQALKYAVQGNTLAPEDPYMLSTYGTLLAGSGKAIEGEQMVRKAVALYPDNMQLKLDLARLMVELGKPESARPYLDLVIEDAANEGLVAQAKELLQTIKGGG